MSEEASSSIVSADAAHASRFWVRALWLGVVVYWLAMFIGSHTPPPPEPHSMGPNDKLVHFSAFAGLSFLLLAAISSTRKINRRVLLFVAALVIGYGAFDELTQPLFGRIADVYDLLADSVGVLIGISCFLALRTFMMRRRAAG